MVAPEAERLVQPDRHVVGVGDDDERREAHRLEAVPAHGVDQRAAQAAAAPRGMRADELEAAERAVTGPTRTNVNDYRVILVR